MLESLRLPEGITQIGGGAFSYCESLAYAYLPDSLTTISASLFKGCLNLSEVRFSPELEAIMSSAFEGCSFVNLTFPYTLTELHHMAFYDNYNLRSVRFIGSAPSGSTPVFNRPGVTFFYPSKDTTWTSAERSLLGRTWKAIPACSNHSYGSYTIVSPPDCSSKGERHKKCKLCGYVYAERMPALGHDLSGVEVRSASKDALGYIGQVCCSRCNYAFSKSEQSITKCFELPASLRALDANALSNTSVEQITIPSGVQTIGYGAFSNCHSLRLVVIPESVTQISDYAFLYLKEAIILCKQDSYAHKYAARCGVPFKLM